MQHDNRLRESPSLRRLLDVHQKAKLDSEYRSDFREHICPPSILENGTNLVPGHPYRICNYWR